MSKQTLSESIDSDSSWEGRADKSPINPIADAKRLWQILLPPKKLKKNPRQTNPAGKKRSTRKQVAWRGLVLTDCFNNHTDTVKKSSWCQLLNFSSIN